MEQNGSRASRMPSSQCGPARTALLAGLVVAALLYGDPLHAADVAQCRIEYSWHTGSTIVEIDPGKTLKINQSNMKHVENLANWHVVLSLSNVPVPTINLYAQGDRDPQPWIEEYAGNVTLVSLECMDYVSAAQLIEAFKLLGEPIEEIAKALVAVFGLAGDQVAAALQSAGYRGNAIAGVLRNIFGYSAAQTATWLKNAFSVADSQIAGWLKDAGYDGGEIAAALKSAFNLTATAAATWLKNAFAASDQQVAQWLQQAGYAGGEIAAALRSALSYAPEAAATWLKNAFGVSEQQVAQWLKDAGDTGEQIAAALKIAFGLDATQSATLLNGIFGGVGGGPIAQWLAEAGYSAFEVARALKDALDASMNQARNWLAGAFTNTSHTLAQWLHDAGYTMELETVHYGQIRECGRRSGSGHGSSPDHPVSMRNTGIAEYITILGNAVLAAATEIDGYADVARYAIVDRGPCYLIVETTVPPSVATGIDGIALVRSSSQTAGRYFWRTCEQGVGCWPDADGSGTTLTPPPSAPPPATPPPPVTLSAPQITAPANGTMCYGTAGPDSYAGSDPESVALEWAPDPAAATLQSDPDWEIRYEVQVENRGAGAGCQPGQENQGNPDGCTWSMTTDVGAWPMVRAGADIAWRVRSVLMPKNGTWPYAKPAATGPWSEQGFQAAPRPHPPALATPTNGSTVGPTSNPVPLSWAANPCPPLAYKVKLERLGEQNGQEYVAETFEYTVHSSQTWYDVTVTHYAKYAWRVQTLTAVGNSDWSAPFTFTKPAPF